MPKQFDGEWLREQLPERRPVDGPLHRQDQARRRTASSSATSRSSGYPLNLYRARNATSRQWATAGPSDHPFATTPVFLARRFGHRLSVLPVDLAGLRVRDVPGGTHRAAATCQPSDMLDRYEQYIYKQWLRVYMQSKMIKNNKDLFQSLDDPVALLDQLHIYDQRRRMQGGNRGAQSRPARFRSHRAGVPPRGAHADRVRSLESPRQLGRPVLLPGRLHVHLPDRARGLREAPRRLPPRGRGAARGEHEQLLQPQGLVRDGSASRRRPLSGDRRHASAS